MNKEFTISDFFEIEKTNSFDIGELKSGEEYDYITRTVLNRGIARRTGFINIDSLNAKNTFSLELMNLTFFFREKEWYAGQFVRIIKPKFPEIVECWEFFEGVFSGISKKLRTVLIRDVDSVFLNSKFEAPVLVDSQNNALIDRFCKYGNNYIVDWNAIKLFVNQIKLSYLTSIKEKHIKKISKYEKILALSLKNIKPIGETIHKEFVIKDLFKIYTGRDVIIRDVESGTIPLVSHTNVNNGISKRVKLLDGRILFNCKKTISLADRGLFWAAAQCEDFHIGTRVKALELKDGEKSFNTMQYLATSINGLQKVFDEYLINATDKLPSLKIWLPIKIDLNKNPIINYDLKYHIDGYIPDWDYMDNYISNVDNSVINDLKKEMSIEISKTKIVLGINDDCVV